MKITFLLGAFFSVPPTVGGAVEKVWLVLGRSRRWRMEARLIHLLGLGRAKITELGKWREQELLNSRLKM